LVLDLFIAMSPPAVEQYWSEVRERKTWVLVDKTLIPRIPGHSPEALAIEATRVAEEEFDNRVFANMVLLGAMAAFPGWIALKAMEKSLDGQIPASALETSRSALRRGFELGLGWERK